jgi:putative transposase
MVDGCLTCQKAGWKKQKDNHPTMRQKISAKAEEKQAEVSETAKIFNQFMRQAIRQALWGVMQQEVEELCGPSYAPQGQGGYRRAGTEKGVLYAAGKKECLRRPRVRQMGPEGIEQEVRLKSYEEARCVDNIREEVFGMMSEGVSSRGAGRVSGQTISATTASRLWVEATTQKLQEFRSRPLGGDTYVGLMLDGVFLTRELVVIVALGITQEGKKRMLDFAVGSSESYEVARDLVVRMKRRGFSAPQGLLAVLDGAAGLRKAVVEQWPQVVIQHCLVHKERNLHRYLRRGDHGECTRLMERLRVAQGESSGREALGELRQFVGTRNAAALASIEQAGEDLIGLHKLNVPATLNGSLLSTNLIENSLRNYRRQTERVTRWQPQTDQVDRWTARALLWVEEGFRKIRGYADLPQLMAALPTPAAAPSDSGSVASSPLRGVPTTSGTLSTPPESDTTLTVTGNL